MAEINIEHPELKQHLEDKEELIKQAREISAKIEALESDRNKVGLQVQKIKDKVVPIVEALVRPQLGYYEELASVALVDGKIVATTFDHKEEWEKAFAEAKTKAQAENNEVAPATAA